MKASLSLSGARNERGAAAVEFALIASILIAIISAVIEFGFAYNELQVMTSAAREGARYAAVRNEVADVVERVGTATVGYATSEAPTVTVSGTTVSSGAACTDDTPGEPVAVSWTQDFEIAIFGLPVMNPDTDIESVFKCE